MWKLAIAFAVFAAVALFILIRSGGDVDIGGEKHSAEAPPAAAASQSPAPAASKP